MPEPIRVGTALERYLNGREEQPVTEIVQFEPEPAEQPQRELFHAETGWFPVLRALIQSGVLARVGPHGIAAYISLKSGASLHNGQTAVSAGTVAAQTGMSEKTAREALKRLEEQGLVSTRWKPGRNKTFQIIERLPITDARGEHVGEAAWDFSSLHWKKQLKEVVDAAARELASALPGGDSERMTTINVGNINVNVNVILVAPKTEQRP
ncbi:GntR family transcriptional regulator [Flagellatimonas centrodinii]|uniref:GntR family transcriptional regulator n=1 Tax=Flagellatimonas centrodinii TaxID=2806210 RepID=UPI001FED3DF3|nr:GntR family transcriptional regulator [Flagellatimonas centrodinii]ULQ46043.1 GntR family transcriptional regulator [Flagellatimonas centrodinii]